MKMARITCGRRCGRSSYCSSTRPCHKAVPCLAHAARHHKAARREKAQDGSEHVFWESCHGCWPSSHLAAAPTTSPMCATSMASTCPWTTSPRSAPAGGQADIVPSGHQLGVLQRDGGEERRRRGGWLQERVPGVWHGQVLLPWAVRVVGDMQAERILGAVQGAVLAYANDGAAPSHGVDY
jgi:hypothetical protein